jgi:hypothetical protein
VNVFLLDGRLLLLSDTSKVVEIDPITLAVQSDLVPAGLKRLPIGEIHQMGSAHPFRAADGSFIGLLESQRLVSPKPLPTLVKDEFVLYKFSERGSEVIRRLAVENTTYAHSFGFIEGDALVVMVQPIYANAMALVDKGTLKAGLATDYSVTTKLFVLSLSDLNAEPIEFDYGDPIFFGHFTNTFRATIGGRAVLVVDVNLMAKPYSRMLKRAASP